METSPRRRSVKRVLDMRLEKASNGGCADDALVAAGGGMAGMSRPSLRKSHNRIVRRSLASGDEARR